jgi:hypothetical protein
MASSNAAAAAAHDRRRILRITASLAAILSDRARCAMPRSGHSKNVIVSAGLKHVKLRALASSLTGKRRLGYAYRHREHRVSRDAKAQKNKRRAPKQGYWLAAARGTEFHRGDVS